MDMPRKRMDDPDMETESLQRLVLDRMAELDLSYRGAAAKSGGLVSVGTLHNIARGRVAKQLTEPVLRGVSLALDVPLSKVRRAAGAHVDRTVEFRLPKQASNLTDSQRKAVLAMVKALLENNNE